MREREWVIPLVFVMVSSLSYASYCDLDLHPYLNITNISSNETYFSEYLTFLGNGTYGFNDNNMSIYLSLICNQNRSFFIIPSENDTRIIQVSLDDDVNFTPNFTISPVKFTNYTIHGWGMFNYIKTTHLDSPYLFNKTFEITPEIPSGTYYQVFEVTNGYETKYVKYVINITNPTLPRIISYDIPNIIYYNKEFNVSILSENTDKVIIEGRLDDLLVKNYTLDKITNSSFKGEMWFDSEINKIVIIAKNGKYEDKLVISKTLNIPSIEVRNVIIPSIAVNQTSRVMVADFDVDVPLKVEVSGNLFELQPNQTTSSTDASFYFADENGIVNPQKAREIYLYITPSSPKIFRVIFNVSILNFMRDYSGKVEFRGSTFTNPYELNFTYNGHPTKCTLQGDDITTAKYVCNFELDKDVDINNLESNEYKLLKQNYETQISSLEKEVDGLKNQRLVMGILLGLILIGAGVYILIEKFGITW